ncbi:hypothetical protein GMRT_14675 [Giardia muris]|uniref:Uncharacterized protein n=1 Tax=Giardia muris TaxID=5742 RepID=A0A4Z1SLK7_GIAMU|nr:hypothetical protein GMRT_14675 [Giardia muris]|eukprot:TNJ26410.1 hypothetical protein GMRT_14675 [Giardia muris]
MQAISFYEHRTLVHSLGPFLSAQDTVVDFGITAQGNYLACLSSGSVLVGTRLGTSVDWAATQVYECSLEKLKVVGDRVYLFGRDYSGSNRKLARPFLAVASCSSVRGKRKTEGASLAVRQKIQSMVSMGTVVTMDVTADEHYAIVGTTGGQVETIRLSKSKALHLTDIVAPHEGKNVRLQVQRVEFFPTTEGVRLAWICASALQYPTDSATVSFLGLYSFNAYGVYIHNTGRLLTPQPTYQGAIASYSLTPGALAYFNYTPDINVVEVLTLHSFQELVLENPNDIARVDTVLRTPHPVLHKRFSSPVATLASTSDGTLLTLTVQGHLSIANQTRVIYKMTVPQAPHFVVYDNRAETFVIFSNSPVTGHALFELKLLSVPARIRVLLRAHLFEDALQLADQAGTSLGGFDPSAIHVSHADYLLSQQRYDEAVEEYSKTVKYLEPCIVLARLLPIDRDDLVVRYLLAVHNAGRAEAPHVAALITFWYRLGRVEEIRRLIRQAVSLYRSSGGEQNSIRDPEAAFHTLRDLGLVEEALAFTVCSGEELMAIDLLVETGRFNEVFCLLAVMDFAQCREALLKYGPVLINRSVKAVHKTIRRLCVSFGKNADQDLPHIYRQYCDSPTAPVPLWIDWRLEWKCVAEVTDQAVPISDFLYLFANSELNETLCETLRTIMNRTIEGSLPFESFSPLIARAYFGLLLSLPGTEPGAIVLELRKYLEFCNNEVNRLRAEKGPAKKGALRALREMIHDGLTHLLTRFAMDGFKEGVLILLNWSSDHAKLIRFYIQNNDLYDAQEIYAAMLDSPTKTGQGWMGQDMWVELLEACYQRHDQEVTTMILHTIEQHRLADVNDVQRISGRYFSAGTSPYDFDGPTHDDADIKTDPAITFGSLASYIQRALGKREAVLHAKATTISALLTSIQADERALQAISEPQTWKKGTCAKCSSRLEPPIVYFGCAHAYHESCASDTCQLCDQKPKQASEPSQDPTTIGELIQASGAQAGLNALFAL